MKIDILEDKKNKLVFEIESEVSGFANLLKRELTRDKNVKAASVAVPHPLISKPKFFVETEGSQAPKKALKDALKRLSKSTGELKKQFEKALK